MFRRSFTRALSFALVMTAAAFFSVGVRAQTVPNHNDPSAHKDALDLSLVPSIRFLTSSDFPPFNFKDAAGELIGFNIDLAEAICAEINADCTIQSWPWAQLNKALVDGQGDAIIAGVSIDADNARSMSFSQSYLQLPGRFVAHQNSDVGAAFDPHALSGVVGVRQNSAHHQFIKAHFKNLTPVTYGSDLDVLIGVEQSALEYAFVDGMHASFWLNQNDCCMFVGGPYFSVEHFGDGLAVAVSLEKENTLRAINVALRRLAESGKRDELFFKWFPLSFY